MKIAIMQPYFMPYIGYWQLIASVDRFVVYDNIKYTKKGWINRNRFLQNGTVAEFTIPLKKDSDFLDVNQRFISEGFNRSKLLNQIRESYRKAPYFDTTYSLFEKIINFQDLNLFKYIYNSIKVICSFLNINTEIVVSSGINIDHSLKGQEKVIAICKENKANVYINAIGGHDLYSREIFKNEGIQIQFIKTKFIEYPQFNNEFIPWLSILDIMMFNEKGEISGVLKEFNLL